MKYNRHTKTHCIEIAFISASEKLWLLSNPLKMTICSVYPPDLSADGDGALPYASVEVHRYIFVTQRTLDDSTSREEPIVH